VTRHLRVFVSAPHAEGPAIVCESGLGGNHHAWDEVRALLGRTRTVVTYDRAGYGNSDPSADGRPLRSLAADLVRVCDAAAPGRRVILVGHSMGGRIARAASAHLGAERVTGLVLVEGASDDFFDQAPRVAFAQTATLRVMGWGSAIGFFRLPLFRRRIGDRLFDGDLHAPALEQIIRDASRRDFWRAVRGEWASMTDRMVPTPAVPAIELVGDGWKDWSAAHRRRMGASPEELLALVVADFRARYPDGRVVTVSDTTHNIQHDHPAVVVDAINALSDAR
jgi:pimeloyl-ACP methyl ester carboxylesterase